MMSAINSSPHSRGRTRQGVAPGIYVAPKDAPGSASRLPTGKWHVYYCGAALRLCSDELGLGRASSRSVGSSCPGDGFPPTVSSCSLVLSLLLGSCAMLVKETGVTVFGVCVVYDALVLCRRPLLTYMEGTTLTLEELSRAGRHTAPTHPAK
ncbi:hypothetical protein Z043_122188 [Scleropages formosus]|uniref:Uncharacterized protein n=1 Tax=Scleropages formosus TaxID=113540 RepID=A0A0P7WF96_SCLFO|nr:hypothetical protein Z043_122188 [Scleropages formosus]